MEQQIENPELAEIDVDGIRAETDAVDVGSFAHDDDERILHRYLRRKSQIAAEITRIRDQTDAMIRSLENREKGLDYVYETIAADITRRKLAGGKSKSLKTPFGTAGFRTIKPGLVVIDEEAVLQAAHDKPEFAAFARVKREVAKSELNAYLERTGEVPVGCDISAGGEKFYVK